MQSTDINFKQLCSKIQDEATRKWLLTILQQNNKTLQDYKMKYPNVQGCMDYNSDMMTLDHISLTNDPLKVFFDITGGNSRAINVATHEEQIFELKTGKYDAKILGGIYNALMPNGNTFFHSAIASDLTNQTLQILQHISTIAQQNNVKISTLVPFCQLDCTDDNNKMNKWVAKNFLMLAIAKKYDNTLNDFCNGVKTTFNYKKEYQQDDYQLIRWLINNAPEECITQKDSDGYNLVDYALMKMDEEVLKQILKRNINLLDQSKIWKNFQNFDYKTAKILLDKRYNKPIAITEEAQWNLQKDEIQKLMNTINNAKDNNDKEKLEASLQEKPVKHFITNSSKPTFTIHDTYDKDKIICCNVF